MENVNLVTGTKKINLQGMECFLPVLIVQEKSAILNKTIKQVYISTSEPLVTKKDALKYAEIWRNDSLAVGYVTYN